jgi:hypothetical protein
MPEVPVLEAKARGQPGLHNDTLAQTSNIIKEKKGKGKYPRRYLT